MPEQLDCRKKFNTGSKFSKACGRQIKAKR